MKTTKFFSVLSLALIFATATLFAGNPVINGGAIKNASIRYEVNLVMSHEKPICGTYVIKIINQNHQLVAPPKLVIPGQTKYVFFERGPADGLRIALLEKAPIHNGGAEPYTVLFAEPVIVKGPFEVGKTYRFDMFPKLTGGDKD